LDDPRHSEAVVTMEMGQADPRDVVRADPGMDHLPLSALTRVE
jgi:hypothetical protein